MVPFLAIGPLGSSLATVAGAAGAPQLDRYIVPNHLRGWVPVPEATVENLVTTVTSTVNPSLHKANLTAQAAGEGWHAIDAEGNLKLDYLMGVYRTTGSTAPYTVPEYTVTVAVETACETATEHPPVTVEAIRGIPGGRLAICSQPTGEQFPPAVAGFRRANVQCLVVTRNVTTLTAVDTAKAQYQALPVDGVAAPSSDSGVVVGIVVAAAIVVIVAIVVVILRRRRRRRAPAAPWIYPTAPVAPAAGWYPDPGNPAGYRYWTGSAWGPAAPQPTPSGMVPAPAQDVPVPPTTADSTTELSS